MEKEIRQELNKLDIRVKFQFKADDVLMVTMEDEKIPDNEWYNLIEKAVTSLKNTVVNKFIYVSYSGKKEIKKEGGIVNLATKELTELTSFDLDDLEAEFIDTDQLYYI